LPVIDVAVTTVARPGDYIHQLIECLRADLGLRLVVGTPECRYLERYRNHPFIEVIEAPPQEWERFRDCAVRQRAAWNYWRTLTLGIRHPYRKGLLIFEDDVVPATDWEPRLHRIIEQIEMEQSGPYILSLYTARELQPPQDGKGFVAYPPDAFFGTQAIYYPEPARKGFAKYLKRHGVDLFRRRPYDFLLGDYARRESIPMFAALPCLVQHIGEVSTGLAQFFHKSPRFQL
jgi:hypothetical protein